MNRIGKLTVLMLGLWAGAAVAGTASSNEFKLDCRTGLRSAVVPEHIQYSTSWATNLTAAQQADAKAVVKVNPCLKTPPKYLVIDMSGGRSAERWPISYLDEVPNGGWTDEYKTEKLVLRYIPAGSFIMGGRATDYPGAVNTNLHMVTLTKPFYIGVFECTQRQWELAMGTRPSWFSNETCYATRPVEQVTYKTIRGDKLGLMWPQDSRVDETSFMGILRRKAVVPSFDLPTEAQWECACRAGVGTALNSGKDINSTIDDPEMDVLGRYHGNHGENISSDSATDSGTAIVGSYMSNKYGLFDMHGNVWEMCLDHWGNHTEGIDPKGGLEDQMVLKGGCWRSGVASDFTSACFSAAIGGGHEDSVDAGVGFRICLRNATVYPSADSTTILVNTVGAAAADWTPTQVGSYQLTHEVQMDGVTVGATESALFKVEGPELVVEANGELEPGVEVVVEKVGGGGEWTIYYTLDGSEPTAEGMLYEGPFALEESATVRAVAISEAGVRSDEARADFTLHDAMSVVGAVARQRYPWNGMVDIDCEITGDPTRVYEVSVIVKDLVGGTNLPVRTVSLVTVPAAPMPRGADQPTAVTTPRSEGAAGTVLAPGVYRFTWNADADIATDFDYSQVAVSVTAAGGPLVGYKRQMTISTDGYTGSETLTNVPVLVRLSAAIPGFDYNDFASPSNGADMVFMTEDESHVLPYEIDEWHTNGESLVWIKLPELAQGTKFKLAYGNAQYAIEQSNNPNNRTIATHEVWREYAGVWHMNEDSGTAFDSTEHGLDALPDHGTNKLADVSQMVAYENGACGRARVNATTKVPDGNFLLVPNYDALGMGDTFAVSGWFYAGRNDLNWSKLFSRSWDNGGWGIETRSKTTEKLNFVGGGGGKTNPYPSSVPVTSLASGWSKLDCVYCGAKIWCYQNGVLLTNGVIVAATDNGYPLAFGNNPHLKTDADAFVGQYDEIRLRGGTLSADRIKADYDMIANKNFCTYIVNEGVGK